MHAYTVYGLGLLSEFPIPELKAAPESSPANFAVTVTLGNVPDAWLTAIYNSERELAERTEPRDPEERESWAERAADREETLCVFEGVGQYVIRGGHTIIVVPDANADFDVVRHVFLGPVLAHLLWQRGIFTLHSSVLGFGPPHARKYAGFIGVSGEGKSTTAAALVGAGHPLVCDDIAALVEHERHMEVLPAFPRIRLYDDSLRSVGDDPEQHPRVHSLIDKRSTRVAEFAEASVTLDRLYVLATGDSFAIDPMPARGALVEVLRHTYYAHQYAPLYGFKKHLEQAAHVVERVPTYRLARPRDLARLPELVSLLEAHVTT